MPQQAFAAGGDRCDHEPPRQKRDRKAAPTLEVLMLDVLSFLTRLRPSSLSCRGSVLIGLALLLPVSASGARTQDAIQARFVGTWELRAVMMHTGDRRATQVWGEHPVGRLVYDTHGQMFALLMPEARNQADGRAIPEALQFEVAGYYGSYVIDSTRQVVTHRVVTSVRAAESGTIERTFSLQADQLTLTARATRDGAPVAYVLTWQRKH